MAKTCQVDGIIYVAFKGSCEECAGHKSHLCGKLDACNGGTLPWEVCPTRNVDTVGSLRAERDRLREINGELLEALENHCIICKAERAKHNSMTANVCLCDEEECQTFNTIAQARSDG